jgi:hypothetical protein
MNRNGERSYSIFDSLGPLSPFEKLHIEWNIPGIFLAA